MDIDDDEMGKIRAIREGGKLILSFPFRRSWLRWFPTSDAWKSYYTLGSAVGILGAFGMLLFLAISAVKDAVRLCSTSDETSHPDDTWTLLPFIPGLTVSWSALIYYVPALAISVLFHEYGHAAAAHLERIPVRAFGVVLAYGVPGAYVDISDVDVMRAPFRSRFRIYSAGILHNITLALFAFGLLALVPWICAPWYSQTSGVVVLHVPTLYHNGSSVPEPSKLQRGDIVKKTDTCSVHDMDSFYSCLRRYKRSYPIELQADDVVTMPLEVQRAIAGADEGQLAFETLRVSMVATWKQFALELEVSQYVPRSPAATQSTLFLYLPFRILVFWTVLGGCSLGLGILNCAAIWTLDGFHIWTTFVSCVAEWMRAEGQQLRLLWSIHAWFVRITTTAFAVLVAFSLLRFISTE